ncbi:hypothetical protein ACFYT4_25300 [Streptomyces sp. NPDC004609]|uniref:hypothetical protein n=1 Tax=Streptomyces sp. NPDC004609 TaxID=3364704 RepID=UPI0036BCC3CF
MPDDELAVGSVVYDTVTGVLGVVMEVYGTRCALRPPRGGREWDAFREEVRPATVADTLSPAVAERNANSGRWGAVT